MSPLPHCYPCSTHQLPPAPSDLKVLLHRGETSSPISKPAQGGKCQNPSRGGGVLLSERGTLGSHWHVQVPGSLLGDQAKHLCRHTCAPAVLHLDPGWLQALRVGLRNYFYISLRAYNMQGVICIIPPSPSCSSLSTNTSASWNFFFLSLHHSISRSRMLFNHQVFPFATCGSKPFQGSGTKGGRSRWCGRPFVPSSSFIMCTFALRSLCEARRAAAGLVFSWQRQADCHSALWGLGFEFCAVLTRHWAGSNHLNYMVWFPSPETLLLECSERS